MSFVRQTADNGGQTADMNALGNLRSDADRYLVIGAHVVDVDTLRMLSRPDGVRLTPKAAAVLLQLVRAGGRTLSRDELINEVWKGTCPTNDVLTQAVKDLRRALDDDLHAPRYVETLPRLGYRLVAQARFVDAAELSSPQPTETPADFKMEPVPVARIAGSPKYWKWLAIGLGVIVAMLAWAVLASRTQMARATAASPTWQVTARHSVTSDPGAEKAPRISPDGTRVSYTVTDANLRNSRIMQRSLGASRAVSLTSIAKGDQLYPAWSPDGAEIAYVLFSGDDCRLVIEPALGGAEREVGRCSGNVPGHFSWAPDARHLLVSQSPDQHGTAKAITLVPIDGGSAHALDYERAPFDMDLDAVYSPDGNRIAFRRGANPFSDLYVMDARGGAVRRLTHLVSTIRGFDWTRDGSALVFSSGHAGEQALYTVSMEDGHVDALGVQPAEFPNCARASDTVVYEIPRGRTQLAMISLEVDAQPPRDIVASTGSDSAAALSPTDDRVAFVSDRGGAPQLWLHDPATDETFALADSDEPALRYPVWRPDGARVLINARGEGWGYLTEIDVATRRRTVLTSPEDDIRYGTYGSAPGRYLAIINNALQARELVEFESREGHAVSKRVLARGVGRFEYDRANAVLYFTHVGQAGLFRIDPRTGPETVATRGIDPSDRDGWLVSAGQLFYVVPHVVGHDEFRVFDLASGLDRKLTAFPGTLADLNFSVSHDRTHAVVVRIEALDTDIGAITLKRSVPAEGNPPYVSAD
ncbi:winged helix-turn-helix domain-containing protein [Dokdonella soli]|uniref:Winged helix-turn-helix domain-containing protein n=1 Tax=Dokdonella soli TaxID=529810 RepID=A0ABP3TZ44_9GAMM